MSQPETKPIEVNDATKELELLLQLPEDLAHDRVLTWIRGGLYLITPEQVKWAVQNKISVDQLLFQYLHLNHPLVRPLAKRIFQIFWKSVSFYLTDAMRLYSILAANQQIYQTLNTQQGRNWIDNCCLQGYVNLFNYVWSS